MSRSLAYDEYSDCVVLFSWQAGQTMMVNRIRGNWLGLAAGVFWALAATRALAADNIGVPIEALPPEVRTNARLALENPTLHLQGPPEVFSGNPDLYYWFLDHPDKASQIWRQLGAKCMTITDRGLGRFNCQDGRGSSINWETVYRSPQKRIWYAEGIAYGSALMPSIPVKAIAVLHHAHHQDGDSRPLIFHQVDLYVHTDSKAAAMVAAMLGSMAPRLANQAVVQLEMFFSALVWYLDRHPEIQVPGMANKE